MSEQSTAAQSESATRSFHCPNCRAEMAFDAKEQRLGCSYCGHTMAIPVQEGRQTVVEYDLYQGLAQGMERGLGTAVRSSRCQECGATVSFPENMTARACDFCGSSQILEQEENRNLIRPESVLPFQVDRKAAAGHFSAWLKGLWFRPSDLKQRAKVTEINGVYVPYWTFDARVGSDWTAEAGYYYYETEEYQDKDSDGNEVTKTREVRRVRWEPTWGSREDQFDDVLVCASRGLPDNLAARLQSFDTGALKPYDPAFLAGWKAEEYSVELNEAWERAVRTMEQDQERRCAGDVPGDTHRYLNVTNRFSDETFKHVLLPLWISAYRYKDKIYRFLINGQTGEVQGKAPWSVPKIVGFSLAVAALVALVAVIVSVLSG